MFFDFVCRFVWLISAAVFGLVACLAILIVLLVSVFDFLLLIDYCRVDLIDYCAVLGLLVVLMNCLE